MGKDWGRICYPNHPKKGRETINMVILIPDGVGDSDLGLVTVFCHPCDALSALHQCDSSELSLVMVRRYSNTPYILRGTCHALYVDMGAFSGGITSA